ncbi:MAG: NADH-ubiquinone oxidoreductase chain F, partial [uncultured Actinomycetospora sp.]
DRPAHAGPHQALARPRVLDAAPLHRARRLHRSAHRARHRARRPRRARQGRRTARARRRRLPDGHEVELHPAGQAGGGAHGPRRQAQVPRHQRRRGRAGDLQGHPADDGRPALAHRGLHHHRVRDPRALLRGLRARRDRALHPPPARRR